VFHAAHYKKAAEREWSKGKGDVAGYVASIKRGTMLYEISGLSPDILRKALRLASHKLSVKTRIVSRQEGVLVL
jgi:large subunit ribosomal protein L16